MFSVIIGLVCINNIHSANILGVFFIPAVSHYNMYRTLYQELLLRGHQVTIVTATPPQDPPSKNLTIIDVSFVFDHFNKIGVGNILAKDQTAFQRNVHAFNTLLNISEMELNSTQFKELLADQTKKFDLIVTECFSPVFYALAERYRAPVVGIGSLGAQTAENDAVGNPIFPILNPDIFLNTNFVKLSMWDKIYSVGYSTWARYYHRYFMQPRAHETAKKYFGDDIEYVGDVERKQSLLLVNTNPVIYSPAPTIPTIVEMGFMHIKPSKPLPLDLQTFLDEAVEGVVYFSLGSNVHSVHVSEKLRTTITEALSELPYKVSWKWQADHLTEKPKNVMIRKWFPQQDLLAHPNVKVFVTQGGLQSVEEAIARQVPMVGMPFLCDQPMNVQKVVHWGIGLGIDPKTVTKDQLKKSIIEVVENISYKNRIREVSQIAYDRPMSGVRKAVWWLEYVIRHKGAKRMKSARTDMSWFHYLLMDVVLAVVGAGLFTYGSLKLVKNMIFA